MLTIATLLLALFAQATFGGEHYHIVPVNSVSLCQYYPNGTCFTLDTFSYQIVNTGKQNITLSFLPGEHLLTRAMTFNHMYSITLINEQESNIPPRISCVENTGLIISNSDTIFMKGLVVYGCTKKGPVIGIQDVGMFYMFGCKLIENYNIYEECIYGGVVYMLRTTAIIRNTDYISNKNENMIITCAVQISGAINVVQGKIEMDSCLFRNNIAGTNVNRSYGSAISLIDSTGYVTNTTFVSNQASGNGGALVMLGSILSITNSTFDTNQAQNFGGAIVTIQSTINITNTKFVENQANKYGGAIAMLRQSRGNITNTTFASNQARLSGGALIGVLESIGIITNSVFTSNEAGKNGGAIQFAVNGYYFGIYMEISKCMFYNNMAYENGSAISAQKTPKLDQTKYLPVFKSSGNVYNGNRKLLGGHIKFGGSAVFSEVSTLFENDLFMNNSAKYGAAMFLSGPFISINMSNCTFTEHRQTHKIDYSVLVGSRITATITNITMTNNNNQLLNVLLSDLKFCGYSRFTNNTWRDNYSGTILASRSTITFSESSTTEISGNKADFGGGLYLNKSTIYIYGDMRIAGNIATISGGAIYASKSEIIFQSKSNAHCEINNIELLNNTAEQKDGGGMYLSDTNVNIKNSGITVSGNSANQFGGGLFFAENSKINVKCNHEFLIHSYLHFRRNSALKGGGVYVSDMTNTQQLCFDTNNQPCFLSNEICINENHYHCNNQSKYTDFDNNAAVITGSDLYGGMLDTCKIGLKYSYTTGITYMKQRVSWNWANNTIENNTELFNHISSDPVKVCFCVNNIIDCTFTPPTVNKKKGEKFTLTIVAVDQVGRPVNASLYSSLINLNGGKGQLKAGQQFRMLPDKCTQLDYNVYHSQNRTVLELYPDGPCGNKGISKKEVHVIFDPCICPLGFEQQHNPIDCSCDCTEALKPYIKQCWQEEGTFQLKDNNWIQNINNTGFIVHDCPFDFCLDQTLNISLSEPSDIQCAFNRTGILCGECARGLSVVFATSQCQPCSNYYLFLLLPFGLAGIALVAFILLLNLTVATGTIYGIVFYANILAANRSVFLPFKEANVLTVFISWLNLDFGIETCLYSRMDSYGKLMLQLVFPAYVFFLMAFIMVLCNRSQKIARLFGKRNPEATLYTLFLLSYSKLIRTIITALQFTTLNYPDGSQEIVWLYDANVKYFALNHIPRLLAAFVITILGAVYTSLLLFGQLFNRCSEYRLMKWTSHKYYIHFLKAHHAPLSDKHRYWVGLLLLARLTHYLISVFSKSSKFIVVSVLIMTLFLLAHKAIFNSYSTKAINLLKIFFLVNLSVLAGLTLYVQVSRGDQQALAIVSMSISLFVFLGIVLYHFLDSCGINLKNVLTNILLTLRNRRDVDYRPVAIIPLEDENISDESDEELLDLSNPPEDTATKEPYDPSRYITPPIIRSVLPDDQLREPALDDLCPLTPADYNIQPAISQTRQKQVPTVTEVVVRD